jgi:hypothetical protein
MLREEVREEVRKETSRGSDGWVPRSRGAPCKPLPRRGVDSQEAPCATASGATRSLRSPLLPLHAVAAAVYRQSKTVSSQRDSAVGTEGNKNAHTQSDRSSSRWHGSNFPKKKKKR